MKKDRFKEIVHNYTSSSDDLRSLKKLAYEYPFSQVVHLLLANAAKNNNSKDFKPNLSVAAFHSTDRGILKNLIENNLVPSEDAKLGIKQPNRSNSTAKNQLATAKSSNIDTDLLIAEVLDNLKILQNTKKETASWFEDSSPKTDRKKKETPTKKVTEVKATKKSPKVKKQSIIIEKFIKEDPRITKNAEAVNAKEDMAKESVKMRDDLVTESLAKIYVNQGKTNKAIDIYKKLIWKLPQKKTLFAAQIEKLKKK